MQAVRPYPKMGTRDTSARPPLHRQFRNVRDASVDFIIATPPSFIRLWMSIFTVRAARIGTRILLFIVSALAPYKRVDLALEAFRRLGKNLIIIAKAGSGALRQAPERMFNFLGWRSNEELRRHYQRARALIFPGVRRLRDRTVEAMAAGCPVIALRQVERLRPVVKMRNEGNINVERLGRRSFLINRQWITMRCQFVAFSESLDLKPQHHPRAPRADSSRKRCQDRH